MLTRSENEGTVARGWAATLRVLLAKPDISGIEYQLAVTDDKITLTTKNEADALAIQAALAKTLQTPSSFLASLPYTIRTTKSSTPIEDSSLHDNTPTPPLSDTVEAGLNLFKNLFGIETFKELSISPDSLFNSTAGANSINQVLFSKPAKGKKSANLWHSMLEALLVRFNNIDTLQLRKILLGDSSQLPEPPDDLASNEKLNYEGLLQKCFGVTEKNDHKEVRLFFDYGLLYRSTFSPAIKIEKFVVTIDKAHINDYLERTLKGGPVLEIIKPENKADQLLGNLIFFRGKKSISMPHLYTALIDVSDSMAPYFAELKKHLIPFIEELKKFDEHGTIRIIFFSNGIQYQDFSLSESWKIREFIENAETRSTTRLFGTIQDELNRLLKIQDIEKFMTNIFLFTDGKDTNSDDQNYVQSSLEAIRNALEKFPRKPQVYPIGFGGYDLKTLNLLSTTTQTPFIHLKSIKDFAQIYTYLSSIRYEQDVIDFLVNAGSTTQYRVPLLFDGNAQSPGIYIPFQEKQQVKIEMKNQQLVVEVKDSRQIRVATVEDELRILSKDIDEIMASDKLNALKKKESLQSLDLQSLEKNVNQNFKIIHPTRELLSSVRDKLAFYLNEITHAIQSRNEGLHFSLMSRARYNLGHTAEKKTQDIIFDDEPQQFGTGRKLLSIETQTDVPRSQASAAVTLDSPISVLYRKASHFAQNFWAQNSDPHNETTITTETLERKTSDITIVTPTPKSRTTIHIITSTKPEFHSVTGMPTWDVHAYQETGGNVTSIGSAKFYGIRSVCRSEDFSQLNLIEAKGVFENFVRTINRTEIQDVCNVLPPSRYSIFFNSMLSGATIGVCRSIGHISEWSIAIKSSATFAKCTGKALQYSSFYAVDFYLNLNPTDWLTTATQSLVKTATLAVVDVGLSALATLDAGLSVISEACNLAECSLPVVPRIFGFFSRHAEKCAFAFQTYTQGPTAIAASIGAGVAVQTVLENGANMIGIKPKGP